MSIKTINEKLFELKDSHNFGALDENNNQIMLPSCGGCQIQRIKIYNVLLSKQLCVGMAPVSGRPVPTSAPVAPTLVQVN